MLSDERLEELAKIAQLALDADLDGGPQIQDVPNLVKFGLAFNPQVGAELVAEVKALRERVFDLARKLVDKDPAAQATRKYLRDK